MKIISFSAGNFKRLTAIEITPTGDIVTLTGDNGAGKSSVLDGIEATVAGKNALPEKPIRDGAVKADTVVKLSNGLTLKRVYTASGSTLKITDSNDAVQPSPQGLLDKLIGNLAFDPLEFSRLKGPEQRAILQKLVGLDFTKTNAMKDEHYSKRTVVNREVDRLTASRNAIPPIGGEVPAEEVPAATVLAEIEDAESRNRAHDSAAQQVTIRQGLHQTAVESVAEAEKQIAAWQQMLTIRKSAVAEAYTHWKMSVDELAKAMPADVAPLKLKLTQLEGQNQLVRQRNERARLTVALNEAEQQSAYHTRQIHTIERENAEALAQAKFPLPGLAFSDDGIFFNNQPWSQISDGEQLRISVAVGMALNPALRVIFIRNGSLLDSKGLALVAEMASANDYQVWLEDARSTNPAAIVIEDGHIKSV